MEVCSAVTANVSCHVVGDHFLAQADEWHGIVKLEAPGESPWWTRPDGTLFH